MAGQRGRDMLVSIGDGGDPEAFMVVAGIRARTLALRASHADCTTIDSPAAWRELIAGAGPKSVEVAGSGAFRDAASDARMRAAFFAGAAVTMELTIAGFGVVSGPFAISELVYGGTHDDEATFSVRLASSGAIAFVAI